MCDFNVIVYMQGGEKCERANKSLAKRIKNVARCIC